MSNVSSASAASILNDKVALISVSISIFSGYRRATADIIRSLGGQFPDSDAITEGSIKVFPSDVLAPLSTARRGLFRKLAARGVRALGSKNVFAINRDDLAAAEDDVAHTRREFEVERANIDAGYELTFDTYAKKHTAQEEAIIRSLKIDRQDALSGTRFASSVFQIAPLARDGDVEDIVQGLARQLYEEVAEEMHELLTRNEAFTTHLRVGQKTLRPIRAAAEKLTKLAFLDPSVEGAVQLIGDTLKALPQAGYIEDTAQGSNAFTALRRLLECMSDADRLFNAAGRVANGVAAIDVLFPAVAPIASNERALASQASPAAPILSPAAPGVVSPCAPVTQPTAPRAPQGPARRPVLL
jgi:hypothetical protein